MKEGYQERLEDAFTNADFIAYTTYASVFKAQGIDVKKRSEWLVESEESVEVDPDKPVPTAMEVDADYKRQQEALMNAMP